jgi:hypothetical protein
MCVTGAEDVDPPGKGGEELSEHRVVGIRHGEIRIVRLLQAEAVISESASNFTCWTSSVTPTPHTS